MTKMSVKDIDLKNKKVIMRVDFNVPLKEDGTIADDMRIQAATETIRYILENGGALILMSHLGRPKGKKDPSLSLKPCAERLSQILNKKVKMAPDCIGEEVESMAKNLKPKEVLLLENLRFYEAETKPETDPSFAEKLSKLAEIYVNDAFGTAHRKHSSTYTITQFFPHKAVAGFLLEKELSFLGTCLQNPKRPFYAIIGGKKISTKMGVIKSLIDKVDALFIGGGMSYSFFKVKGISIGKSIFEEDQLENVKEIIKKCEAKDVKLFLPKDIVIADNFSNDANKKIIMTTDNIDDSWEGMDIGPQTIEEWSLQLKDANTIFWNGPLGVNEFLNFIKGTQAIAQALSRLPATTIVGGGDSIAAIRSLNLDNKFSHLSTGGGASLEFIEHGHLPGIDALSDK